MVIFHETPIVIDVARQGFSFTDLENGVYFDMDSDGEQTWFSWTDEEGGNAFLALDRNGNGFIDNGSELFGNFTYQPPSAHPNGYKALAVFDEPANGGNGDGMISEDDAVFDALRLWVDSNHDGASQEAELFQLCDFDISAVYVTYSFWHHEDQYGNVMEYKSKARRNHGGILHTTDVFFLGLELVEP